MPEAESSEKKWIEFVRERTTPSGLTKIWDVEATEGRAFLGTIKWYAPWRCYAFFPMDATVFEMDCLYDISTFLYKQQESRIAQGKKS